MIEVARSRVCGVIVDHFKIIIQSPKFSSGVSPITILMYKKGRNRTGAVQEILRIFKHSDTVTVVAAGSIQVWLDKSIAS